jgi:hypothetical protein
MITRSDPARTPLLIVQIILVAALFVTLTLAALSDRGPDAVTPASPTAATHTQVVVTPSAALTPTATASAAAAASTPTLPPTEAPLPTPTEQREPIVLTGSGDSIKYPQKWIGPALVRINHSGDGPFLVWTQDQNAERVDLLAKSPGPYQGASLIDFTGAQRTLRFEVRAAGTWQIQVLPLSLARHENVPGLFQGTGDEAVVLQGAPPDLMTVDASSATGELSIWSYGRTEDLLVNTTAPYMGTVAIPKDAAGLGVKASGPWSIEITTR